MHISSTIRPSLDIYFGHYFWRKSAKFKAETHSLFRTVYPRLFTFSEHISFCKYQFTGGLGEDKINSERRNWGSRVRMWILKGRVLGDAIGQNVVSSRTSYNTVLIIRTRKNSFQLREKNIKLFCQKMRLHIKLKN